MKDIQITVDRSRWMASEEYAYLKVTSPTGKHVFIEKCKLHLLNEAESEIVQRLANEKLPESIAVSWQEMNIILQISKK